MDPTPFVVGAVLAVVVASAARQNRLRRTLDPALLAMGLRRDEVDAYHGVVDGLSIEVATPIKNGRRDVHKVIVRSFSVPEYLGPHATRPFARIVTTGDDAFDGRYAACGDEAAIRSALDAATRSEISTTGVIVHYGMLERSYDDVAGLQRIVACASRLHRRMTCTDEARLAGLEENVRTDPSPGVRAHSLDTLVRVPGGLSRAAALARAPGLDETLRLRAAIAAGSTEVLAAIAASSDEGDRVAAATEALGSLQAKELGGALDRVRELLRARPNEALVRVLGRYGTVADVALLASLPRASVADAIREIQGRIVGADGGALALADVGGEIAVADEGGLAITRTGKGDPPS
jgi:hypothetical protein